MTSKTEDISGSSLLTRHSSLSLEEWDVLLGRLHGHLNKLAQKLVAVISRGLEERNFPTSGIAILQPQLKREIWDQKDRCADKITLTVSKAAGIAPAKLPSHGGRRFHAPLPGAASPPAGRRRPDSALSG